MSRHDGVSCDACLKANFRGRRFKCLICYDYDLCAGCFESGVVTSRHSTEHAMQCILTRSDFELYYSGEILGTDQPQAFTCPYCGRMGHTEASLQEHVAAEHVETPAEVICPICASQPGGDPNLVTDDFAGHLTLEHRSGPRDLISFLDEPTVSRHGVRRIPHPASRGSGNRPRRTNMHFSSSGGLSPSARDSVDPIAELLSQLSGVRRSAGQSSTLQQLQMQLQLERQQVRAARQQLERLPRRQNTVAAAGPSVTVPVIVPAPETPTHTQPNHSQFLLARITEENRSDAEQQDWETDRADRSLFVQELFLSMLAGMEALQSPGNAVDSTRPSLSSSNPGPCNQSWSLDSGVSEPVMAQALSRSPVPVPGLPVDGPGTASSGPTDDVIEPAQVGSPSSSSIPSESGGSSGKRPARMLPTPQTAGPRPQLPTSGLGIRTAAGAAPVRPLFGLRPSTRKFQRPLNGRNQTSEPQPPPH